MTISSLESESADAARLELRSAPPRRPTLLVRGTLDSALSQFAWAQEEAVEDADLALT